MKKRTVKELKNFIKHWFPERVDDRSFLQFVKRRFKERGKLEG